LLSLLHFNDALSFVLCGCGDLVGSYPETGMFCVAADFSFSV